MTINIDGLNAILTDELKPTDTTVYLSTQDITTIASAMGTELTAYATIRGSGGTETVIINRPTVGSNFATIVRGQLGSSAAHFMEGACLNSAPTWAQIEALVTAASETGDGGSGSDTADEDDCCDKCTDKLISSVSFTGVAGDIFTATPKEPSVGCPDTQASLEIGVDIKALVVALSDCLGSGLAIDDGKISLDLSGINTCSTISGSSSVLVQGSDGNICLATVGDITESGICPEC